MTRCVFPLKQWGHLHARPRALFPLGTLAGSGRLGGTLHPWVGGGGGQDPGPGPAAGATWRHAVRPDPGSGLPTGQGFNPADAGSQPSGRLQRRISVKVFLSGEDVHGSVSFLAFRVNLLPLQTVKHARAHTHARAFAHSDTDASILSAPGSLTFTGSRPSPTPPWLP